MQHSHVEKPNGNRPITIEVEGEPIGVVIPGEEGFRFLAVRFHAFPIDGRIFDSVDAARAAASLALNDAH
jgi:hypothetical protein